MSDFEIASVVRNRHEIDPAAVTEGAAILKDSALLLNQSVTNGRSLRVQNSTSNDLGRVFWRDSLLQYGGLGRSLLRINLVHELGTITISNYQKIENEIEV